MKTRSAAALAVVALFALAGCQQAPPAAPAAPAAPSKPRAAIPADDGIRDILIEVVGEGRGASITLRDLDGTRQFDTGFPMMSATGELGLSGTFGVGDFYYISAQNLSDSGWVSCRVTIEGVVVSEVRSDGGYKIATCSGVVQ